MPFHFCAKNAPQLPLQAPVVAWFSSRSWLYLQARWIVEDTWAASELCHLLHELVLAAGIRLDVLFGLQMSIAVKCCQKPCRICEACRKPASLWLFKLDLASLHTPTLQAGHCQQREERAEDPGRNARIPSIQQHGENTLSVMLRLNWQMVLRFLMLSILSHGV